MALPNNDPIYSRVGDIQGGEVLVSSAGDFSAQNANNVVVFVADPTNGGYIQRLRFKALSTTTAATVARVYIANENSTAAYAGGAIGGISGTQSTTGGSMNLGPGITWFAKAFPVDALGAVGAESTAATATALGSTTSTGSITWTITAPAAGGAVSYIILSGLVSTSLQQLFYVPAGTTTYIQTTNTSAEKGNTTSIINNAYLYGEIALPIATVTATGSTPGPDIDYPLNMALPPGHKIVVGLSAAAGGSGWQVMGIGGAY